MHLSRSLTALRAALPAADLRRLLHDEKVLIKVIAIRYGTNRRTVTDLRVEYGIPARARRHVSIDPHELRDLWRARKSGKQMARHFGVTIWGIRKALKRFGLVGKKAPWRRPEKKEDSG